MSILNDANYEAAESLITEKEPFEDYEERPEENTLHFDFSFLRTPTGAGSIEDYTEHALNPHGSRGIAQILRGVTGFAGSLNLAVIDITFGLFELSKERRTAPEQPKPAGVNYEPIIKG